MNYIKELDSLRAIAVILVILHHWFPEGHPLSTYAIFFNGVDIFFVLSGFLITRILLENRKGAEQNGNSKLGIIKGFFIRRTLRIFPVYYLLVAFLFILGSKTGTGIRENILYFLTYTSNFYFYKINEWDGMLSHLWSLSVEEQFYLLWPWLMLFTNKRFLLLLIVISILIGVTGQILLFDEDLGTILTFACFDSFGLGALVAWIHVYRPAALKPLYTPAILVAVACCVLQAIWVFSDYNIFILPPRTLTSFCTVAIIIMILLQKDKDRGFSGLLLNNKGLHFIGKISYGIYLYHFLIPNFAGRVLYYFTAYQPSSAYAPGFYLLHFGYFCILLGVSYASWKLIEQPILKYKNKFEYQKPLQTSTVGVVTTKEVSKLSQQL